MAEASDPSGRNGEMDIQSIADLSLDDYTFDQHIDARSQSNNTSRRHGTEVLGQVRTVDGQVLTTENTGTDNVGFIRVKTRPTSDENAYFKNILPVPALDCYAGTPPPSEKVGKFVKHPEYLATNYRLLSYYEYEWPLQEPNPARLANAGFFYTGRLFEESGQEVIDQVYCYKCGESIRQWSEDDDPLEEHRRLHPRCFQETWLTE